MSTAPVKRYTPQEYLSFEREADSKHQYFEGEIFAMAGASPRHNIIASNLTGELRQRLKGRDCVVVASDQRVKVDATGLFTYPDIVVVCGEMEFDDQQQDTLLNPTLLIEVLSDSTEMFDRGKKFEHYRRLPSLQEYVLVSQNSCHVERYRRQGDHEWVLWETRDPNASMMLQSVDVELPLAEIYDKVVFETITKTAG